MPGTQSRSPGLKLTFLQQFFARCQKLCFLYLFFLTLPPEVFSANFSSKKSKTLQKIRPLRIFSNGSKKRPPRLLWGGSRTVAAPPPSIATLLGPGQRQNPGVNHKGGGAIPNS